MKKIKALLNSKLLSTATKFGQDEKGNFAIMGAVTMAMLVAGLSLAVDLSSGISANQRLQDTTDAIALLAARGEIEGQENLTAAAQEYFNLTYPGQSGSRIVLDSITRDGDAVTIVASNTQDTYFTGIFGKSGLDVKVSSTAEFASRNLNLALVLDTTGSMQGSKIATLKVAGNELVKQLSNVPDDKLSVSVVPFAQYVNVGTSQVNQNWIEFPQTGGAAPNSWTGCVGSRLAPLNTRIDLNGQIPGLAGVACPSALQPLTKNLNNVKQAINGLKAEGWTYMPAGIAWGWRTLTPKAPFVEASAQDQNKTDKIMVVMTDGANTRSQFSIGHNGQSQNDADNVTAKMCDNAKRDGIAIYTIAYEITDGATQNLLKNCASSSEHFFNASNGSQLREAFQEIGANLSALRLSS